MRARDTRRDTRRYRESIAKVSRRYRACHRAGAAGTSAGHAALEGIGLMMMHQPEDAVPENIRAFLDKLSSDELVAAHRHLEQVMEARGIDPYAYLDDIDDDLDEAERQKLDAAIDRGIAQADAGQTIPAEDVLAELRRRR
ncbi:MAG: hypothetical protein IT381_24745 [Deltaproteobacteria bacterium]|nr:hypothetical protein [Deltaproteobacteria bacterium]